MKKIMFIGAFVMGITSLFAQKIEFVSENLELGEVKVGETIKSSMKFKNVGTEPLVLKSVVGSCGCTVPEYPTTPIKPGDTAEIKISYSVGSSAGSFSKTVTIHSNDVEASRKFFRVKGNASL